MIRLVPLRTARSSRHPFSLLRAAQWSPTPRVPFFASAHNGRVPSTEPPVTYFQGESQRQAGRLPPQPSQGPKLRWRIFRGTLIAVVSFYAGALLVLNRADAVAEEEAAEQVAAVLQQGVWPSAQAMLTYAQYVRGSQSFVHDAFNVMVHPGYTVGKNIITHVSDAASNVPTEDFLSAVSFPTSQDPERDWYMWTICDGHAGARLSSQLVEILPIAVDRMFSQEGIYDKEYSTGDPDVYRAIVRAFIEVDDAVTHMFDQYTASDHPLSQKTALAMTADSGSCAIMAIFDPVASVLRVANTGDSRAVLGRWNEDLQRYEALALSYDHTGFNTSEVARIKEEHPGEEPIDESDGRLFGLAVTRAFGNVRWKWSDKDMEWFHKTLFTNRPRPGGVIKTPPYLTAKPEITETEIRRGYMQDHPDFMIMASDGLWDQLSSDEAVNCVQLWLDKFSPRETTQAVLQEHQRYQQGQDQDNDDSFLKAFEAQPAPSSPLGLDCHYDEKDKAIKWTNNEAHFVAEDENCSSHLIRNALGGDRKDLTEALLLLPPSHSRNVRDDISVQVVFFDVDTSGMDVDNGRDQANIALRSEPSVR